MQNYKQFTWCFYFINLLNDSSIECMWMCVWVYVCICVFAWAWDMCVRVWTLFASFSAWNHFSQLRWLQFAFSATSFLHEHRVFRVINSLKLISTIFFGYACIRCSFIRKILRKKLSANSRNITKYLISWNFDEFWWILMAYRIDDDNIKRVH